MRYEKIRKPMFCPNASRIGGDYQVKGGELIAYSDSTRTSRLGRVLGRATHAGDGSEFKEPTLVVMTANDTLTAGYLRAVPLEDVTEVRSIERRKGSFALWFLFGEMPEPEEAERAVEYGMMSDHYIDRWLVGDELRFNEKWEEGVR